MKTGAKIHLLMEQYGISVAEAATIMGVATNTVYGYKAVNSSRPTPEALLTFLGYLKQHHDVTLPMEWFYLEDDEELPTKSGTSVTREHRGSYGTDPAPLAIRAIATALAFVLTETKHSCPDSFSRSSAFVDEARIAIDVALASSNATETRQALESAKRILSPA